jgi:hypothetical protein
MADWVTISSLATAGGTLVLAGNQPPASDEFRRQQRDRTCHLDSARVYQ